MKNSSQKYIQPNVNSTPDSAKQSAIGQGSDNLLSSRDKEVTLGWSDSTLSFYKSLSKVMMTLISVFLAFVVSFTTMGQANAANLGDLFGDSPVGSSQQSFLKVDQAFSVDAVQKGNKLNIQLRITPEHYLYKDKLSLQLPAGVKASALVFSQSPQSIDDPVFGKVAVFKQPEVTATTTLTNTLSTPINQEIKVKWQGCAEAGLCYPPQTDSVTIRLPATTAKPKSDAVKKPISTSSPIQSKTVETSKKATAAVQQKQGVNQENSKDSKVGNNKAIVTTTNPSSPSNAIEADRTDEQSVEQIIEDDEAPLSEENNTLITETSLDMEDGQTVPNAVLIDSANNVSGRSALNSDQFIKNEPSIDLGNAIVEDPFGLTKHPWFALGLLFLAGLGLAFTPCVLPMLPIVSNIVARQNEPTARKGLMLSGSYALGVAIAYGILGAIIALFGQSLGINGWLQNPIILLTFAAIFVVLAFYMMDVIKIPIPNAIKQKAHSFSQAGDKYLGTAFGSFIAGLLSALVVSPCVSAPLAGALAAVSTVGSPLLGFAALFMLGFGLSAPLMLLGVSQGKYMPKTGEWMNWIKQGFALMLFAVALLLIERVLRNSIVLMLWAFWFMVVAVWAWTWQGRGQLMTKPVAVILAVWSIASLVGAAAGSDDTWQPLRVFAQSNTSIKYDNPNEPIQTSKVLNNGSLLSNADSQVETQSTLMNSQQRSDIHISTLDDLIPLIENNPKVLVDVTADWCVECRIMDKTLFTNRPKALQDWLLVRLDVTETNDESARILSELKLFGPPALLYFVEGKLEVHQVGTIDNKKFKDILSLLN